MPAELDSIAEAQELYDWFGFWPGFHDAEVVRLHLNRKEPSHLAINTWEMTKRVDSQGDYELANHVMVEFILGEVSTLSLQGFSGLPKLPCHPERSEGPMQFLCGAGTGGAHTRLGSSRAMPD